MKTTLRQISLILFFILSNCMGYCQIQGIVNVSNINPGFNSIWDYDNDGDLDFSVQYGGEYPLNGYRYRIVENVNNQDYFPHNPMKIDNSNPYNLIGDYDVDSDGEKEFIARYTNSSNIPFAIEKGDWDEVWTTTPLYDTIPNGQTQINGLVDFNNDNCMDLLLITSSPDRIGYLPCLGSFTDYESTLQEYSPFVNQGPSKFLFHDQNNDSFIDVIIYSDYMVKTIENQNGLFIENSTITTTDRIDTLVDVDNDGRLDIMLENQSYQQLTQYENKYTWKFFSKQGQSNFSFGEADLLLTIQDTAFYQVYSNQGGDLGGIYTDESSYFGNSEWADFDGNGDVEMMVFSHHFYTGVYNPDSFFINNLYCNFMGTKYNIYNYSNGSLSMVEMTEESQTLSRAIAYSFFAVRDINLDGLPEILFNGTNSYPTYSYMGVNYLYDTDYLLVQQNIGNFNFVTDHPMDEYLGKLGCQRATDFNQDGLADFVSCNNHTKQLSLFKNLGEFEWDFPITCSLNFNSITSCKFAYLSDDTVIDLLYLNEDSTSLYSSGVTLPNPCQTQANIYQASVGSKLTNFTEIDFNLDGLNDLMLEEIPQNNNPTNNAETKLIYLVNNGNSLSEWTNSFTIYNRYYQKTITNEDEFISTTFLLDSLPNGSSYLRMINNLTQSSSNAIPIDIFSKPKIPFLVKSDSLRLYLYYVASDKESIVRREIYNFIELGVEESIAQIDSIATLLEFQDTNNNGIQELFYLDHSMNMEYFEEPESLIRYNIGKYQEYYNINELNYFTPKVFFSDINQDGFLDVLYNYRISINGANNNFFKVPNYVFNTHFDMVDLNNDQRLELLEDGFNTYNFSNDFFRAHLLKFVKHDFLDVSYLGGTVFIDTDEDGIQDNDEVGIDHYFVHTGNGVSYTNNAGHYAKYNWTSDTLDIHCPLIYPHWYHTTSPDYSFMPDSSIYQNNFNFGLNTDTLFYANINYFNSPNVNICNETTKFFINNFNSGSLPYNIECELKISPVFELISPSLYYESQGSYITYYIPQQLVLPLQGRSNTLEFLNPSSEFLGQNFETELKISYYSLDGELVDTEIVNSVAHTYCPHDPNHKSCNPIGEGEEHFIRPNLTHHYKIDFQNLGNYFATNILIRDTISPHFDIHSFNLISTTHNTQVNIDYDTRVVEFKMPAIYLIPAYQDSLLSQGSVSYTIDQLPELPDFTIIENKAYIYFDLNSPIITNNYTHTISRNYFIENPLAIRLIDFDVEKEDKSNLITWTATTDETESYFRLLKSTDGANFVLLKELFIDPLAMNSTQYVVNDEDYNFENVYYKLQVVNLSGAQRDLGIRFVSRSAIEIIEVFPNPVRDMLTISNKSNTELLGSIYDVRGNKITTIQLGINDPLLLSVKDWPVGVYSIEFNVQGVDRTQVTKFVKY